MKKLTYKISGMHCASCEVLLERQFKKIHGVIKAKVDHVNGQATLECFKEPKWYELDKLVKPYGYHIIQGNGQPNELIVDRNTSRDYLEISAVFLILVALYLIFKQFNIIPSDLGITENMSYGFVFVIGLVAALSTCIAVTGGLLLAVAGKYNEKNGQLTGLQKFKPHLYFNIGRIISYTLLGGAIGSVGSIFTISPKTTGFVTIVASLVMIILGFQMLKLFPWLKRFTPRMPKWFAHKIEDSLNHNAKGAPFLFGASTFFLPCGFTQALQLYVLSKGDFMTGALTMLAFSLGTLPALLSLSAVSSFAKGSFQRYFVKFAGVLVLMLGFSTIGRGFALTGNTLAFSSIFNNEATLNESTDTDMAPIINGEQIAEMAVTDLSYSPSQFKVKAGIPVRFKIDGRGARGCGQVVVFPSLGISKYLSKKSVTEVTFTPGEAGFIEFSCPMAMTTPGSGFVVVENDDNDDESTATTNVQNEAGRNAINRVSTDCDPTITSCPDTQNLFMKITREEGFSPNNFTVKVNKLVVLEIDTQVRMGGCMSTMIIPELDIAQQLTLGKSYLKFTPKETGKMIATCSMGIPMVEFNVVQ